MPAGIEIKTKLMSILSSASSLERVDDVCAIIPVQLEVTSLLLGISTGLGWVYSLSLSWVLSLPALENLEKSLHQSFDRIRTFGSEKPAAGLD